MGNKHWRIALACALIFPVNLFAFAACADAAPTAGELAALWPRIDGSTATQPLTNAIYSHFTGVETSAEVSAIIHHKTYTAYRRLLAEAEGAEDEELWDEDPIVAEPVELIFVTAPYDEELEQIGEDYELVPVVKDALVFLNNQRNPITDLSGEQLRQIYTGKIVDWSELGGTPGKIRAYQRQKSSGSQTLFQNLLMRELEPAQAPEEWYHGEMGGLVDAVAAYDNADFALGYNMYYFVANMHYDWRVRMLAVDGVEPTDESIASDRYPLNTAYYAVYAKALPADHPARKLVAWLRTDEGQRVARAAGYVPLRALPGQPPVKDAPGSAAPASLGTAPRGNRWDEPPVTDRLPVMCEERNDAGEVTRKEVFDYDTGTLVAVFPQAPAMEAEINAWLAETRRELAEKHGIQEAEDDGQGEEDEDGAWINESAELGCNLLTIRLDVSDEEAMDFDQRYAVFDLKNQRRMRLCDLFYEGFDYLRYINDCLAALSLGAPDMYSAFNDSYFGPYPYEPTYPYDVVSDQVEFGFGDWDWDWQLYFALENDARFSGVAWYDMPSRVNPAVPLWHDISPFGACKAELQFERQTEPLEKHRMLVPKVIGIDDGKRPEAEAAINAEIARATERMRDPAFEAVINEKVERAAKAVRSMAEHVIFDEKGIILPKVVSFGRFLTVGYYVSVGDIESTLWGQVYDLHTGQPLFQPEQLREALASPNAGCWRMGFNNKFRWAPIKEGDFPEGSTLCAVGLVQADGEDCLELLVDLPQGKPVRVKVPMREFALPDIGDFE